MSVRDQQAFPTSIAVSTQDDIVHGPEGLTKREYFAGLAMQALVMNRSSVYNSKEEPAQAVRMADALIAELEKK